MRIGRGRKSQRAMLMLPGETTQKTIRAEKNYKWPPTYNCGEHPPIGPPAVMYVYSTTVQDFIYLSFEGRYARANSRYII